MQNYETIGDYLVVAQPIVDGIAGVPRSLPGEQLGRLVRVMNACRTCLPQRMAARIVADAASALHLAHTLSDASGKPLNIVHGDIGTKTIMVTPRGVVRVVDLAKRSTEKPADRRADIRALGSVLYELLCGQPPADSSIRVTDRQTSQTRSNALTYRSQDVDGTLDDIVAKAMAPSHESGYAEMSELRRDLVAYLETSGEIPSTADLAKLLVNTFGTRHVASLERQVDDCVLTPFTPPTSPSIVTAEAPYEELAPHRDYDVAAAPFAENERSLFMSAKAAIMQRFWGAAIVAAMVIAALIVFGRGRVENTTLHVSSTPSGAAIFVDGDLVGSTPIDFANLRVGRTVEVTVSAPKHETYQHSFTPGAEGYAVHATLARTRAFETTPDRASQLDAGSISVVNVR